MAILINKSFEATSCIARYSFARRAGCNGVRIDLAARSEPARRTRAVTSEFLWH